MERIMGTLQAQVSVEAIGSLQAKAVMNGVTSATLSVRPGIDGVDGRDGISPTIEVHADSPSEYVLKITDVNGSFYTPNLIPTIDGLADIQKLVSSKVDKEMAKYPVLKISQLLEDERSKSFVYAYAVDTARKIPLTEIPSMEEVDEKVKRKLQTVDKVPEAHEWQIGDYILLDRSHK